MTADGRTDGRTDGTINPLRAHSTSTYENNYYIVPRSGSYGEVYLGVDRQTAKNVAIKFEWTKAHAR